MIERATPARARALPAVSAAQWARLDAIVDEALDAPTGARHDVVVARCGEDTALRDAALQWLDACERTAADAAGTSPDSLGPALGTSLRDADAADDLVDALRVAAEEGEDPEAADPRIGARIGAWRLLRPLGRGGMGVVYLAERADADVPMRAALKLMLGATAFDAVGVRRFRDERRILAALDHPAIARLLDGGIADGLPWFAMEFVDGAPIDRWCDARRLPVDDRLRLFATVCDAVQHAHTGLVVHRDLKPANVLVSDAGAPKLLDFGIAKLLSAGDPSDPALTRPGLAPMTEAYAAPEQRRGDPPSTAMDVYALGVVLHVLLVGVLPEPGRLPSSTAHTVDERSAITRSTSPARLARRLRGDLDTIFARAMSPEPARRYASADALAADVRRHLDGLPVLARRDTLAYRIRKLVTRHPVGSAATVGGLALVLTFAGLATVQASRLREQAATLVAERDKATEVTSLLSGILSGADPYREGDATPTLREVLDRGAARMDEALRDRPETRAQILGAMAPAYFGLGDWDRAGAMAEEAVALRRRAQGPDHPALAASLVYLANVRLNQGRAAEAETQAREALAIRRRLPDQGDGGVARALSTLGSALQRQGKLADAERVLRDLLATERARRPRAPRDVAQVARNLAHVLRQERRHAEAAPLYAEAYTLHREVFGDEHPESANSAVNLGVALANAGDTVAGLGLMRQGLAIKRRLLGITHQDVAGDQLTLARVLLARGDSAEARALRVEAESALARGARGSAR